MGIKDKLNHIYDHHYKHMMIVPQALLVIAIIILFTSLLTKGYFVEKGVSLSGGLTLTFTAEKLNVDALQSKLAQEMPGSDVSVRELTQANGKAYYIAETTNPDEKILKGAIEAAGIPLKQGEYSLENIGSSLGKGFFTQMIWAVVAAFLGMAVVVFITFRVPVPSFFVVLAAASTIIETLAVCNLLGVRLGAGGVAAFLMLIGYSVDTDILLTTRVIRRKEGTIHTRTVGAIATGLTMTLTGLAASLIGLLFTQSDVIRQIMLIITIGLVFDILNTWLQNAPILRWYLEKKGMPK